MCLIKFLEARLLAVLLCFSFPQTWQGTELLHRRYHKEVQNVKNLGAQQWLTFPPAGYLSVHRKIWFYLRRPVRRQEVRIAAFKQGTGQMFQFPTWRTGSADAKGAKRLLGIVTTLRFLLPPPTLNLLPWSCTVWAGAVKLLRAQGAESPRPVEAGRDFAAAPQVPPSSRSCPGYEGWTLRAGEPGQPACTARPGETKVCAAFAFRLLSVCFAAFSCSDHFGVLLTVLLTPGR